MYNLTKLFKWEGGSFDLSDEGSWLDLLDDFGPALPRFLLDDCVQGGSGVLAHAIPSGRHPASL